METILTKDWSQMHHLSPEDFEEVLRLDIDSSLVGLLISGGARFFKEVPINKIPVPISLIKARAKVSGRQNGISRYPEQHLFCSGAIPDWMPVLYLADEEKTLCENPFLIPFAMDNQFPGAGIGSLFCIGSQELVLIDFYPDRDEYWFVSADLIDPDR